MYKIIILDSLLISSSISLIPKDVSFCNLNSKIETTCFSVNWYEFNVFVSISLINFWDLLIFHLIFNNLIFASSGFLDDLIIFITLSKFSTLTISPINVCAFSSALFRSNFVFLITTSSLNFKKFSKKSLRLQFFGFLSTIANVLKPKELSIDVYLNNCLLTVSGSTFLLKSIETLIPSLFDSSLMSLMPSIFFSLTSSAILSFKLDLLTW